MKSIVLIFLIVLSVAYGKSCHEATNDFWTEVDNLENIDVETGFTELDDFKKNMLFLSFTMYSSIENSELGGLMRMSGQDTRKPYKNLLRTVRQDCGWTTAEMNMAADRNDRKFTKLYAMWKKLEKAKNAPISPDDNLMSSYSNNPLPHSSRAKGAIRISCNKYSGANIYLDKHKIGICKKNPKNFYVPIGKHHFAVILQNGDWKYQSIQEVTIEEDETIMPKLSFSKKPSKARGERLNKRFERKGKVVIDYQTGWMWQDNKSAQTISLKWNAAKSYCRDLQLDGYSDWYLPSAKQMDTLLVEENLPSIIKQMINVSNKPYWTSSNGKQCLVDNLRKGSGLVHSWCKAKVITFGSSKLMHGARYRNGYKRDEPARNWDGSIYMVRCVRSNKKR